MKARADNANHIAVAEIRAVMENYAHKGTLHLGGVPMIVDDMVTFIGNDLVTFGFGVVVFLILMLSVIFREVRWVILPLASCLPSGLQATLMVALVCPSRS